jgi:hypothetical protein
MTGRLFTSEIDYLQMFSFTAALLCDVIRFCRKQSWKIEFAYYSESRWLERERSNRQLEITFA